jgi:hypothetical protein
MSVRTHQVHAASTATGGVSAPTGAASSMSTAHAGSQTGVPSASAFQPLMASPPAPVFEAGVSTSIDPFGSTSVGVFTTTTSGSVNQGQIMRLSLGTSGPPSGMESLAMPMMWLAQGGFLPTAPALSVDGTKIYFGDSGGLEAYSTATGANVWTVPKDPSNASFQNGFLVTPPAVIPVLTPGGGPTSNSEIIFGTDNSTPELYDYADPAGLPSSPAYLWGLSGAAYDQASPAISGVALTATADPTIFAVTSDGKVTAVG